MAKVLTLGTSGIEELNLDPTIYYQEISVENEESSTLTDYQVKFTINTSALITASKLNTDATNMRVLDSADNEVPFGYINETWNTTTTEFWLKIPTILGSETKVYKFAYGNSNWTSKTADLDDVMNFVDEFEGSSVDTSKWNVINTPTVSGGELTLNGTDRMESIELFNLNTDYITCHYATNINCYNYSSFGMHYDGDYSSKMNYQYNKQTMRNYNGSGNYNDVDTGTTIPLVDTVVEFATDTTNSKSRCRYDRGAWTDNTIDYPTSGLTSNYLRLSVNTTAVIVISYIYVRKYTANEPTVTIGSETEYDSASTEHAIEDHTNVSISGLENNHLSIYNSTSEMWENKHLTNISGLPTSATGLSSGDLWNDSGTLKIV